MPHDIRAIDCVAPGLLRAALDCMPAAILLIDKEGTVQLANERAIRLLGLARPGHKAPLARVLGRSRALDRAMRLSLTRAIRQAMQSSSSQLLLTLQAERAARSLSVDIRSAGQSGWVVSLEDVTETRLTQDWMIEHASTDAATGLLNRQHFLLLLQHVLDATGRQKDAAAGPENAGAAEHPDGPAVIVVSLRKLSDVNNTLGGAAGDFLLQMVADRLAECLEDGDLLARCAGNRFSIAALAPATRQDIAARAQAMLQRLSSGFVLEENAVQLSVRLGISLAVDSGASAEALLNQASLSVPDTEDFSSRRIGFFDVAMTEQAQWRRAMEADLRGALERREFFLHYQPQVDVLRNAVTGFEALIRWASPARGRVPPAEFIPIAEDIGLIGEIGEWVLRQACAEAAAWPPDITVAVNASALQFEAGDYAETVAEVLAQTGLPAQRLEIEITESFLLRDTGAVVQTLTGLQAQGVRLVVDDFGTGYASLSQLTRFHFDKIKIDRSFVSAADGSAENNAIVRSVAALARSLGIPSTAEGVETQGQLEQIKADGCTCVQGYFFSPPVPAQDVRSVLARLQPASCAA